jgi:hypothetical protein
VQNRIFQHLICYLYIYLCTVYNIYDIALSSSDLQHQKIEWFIEHSWIGKGVEQLAISYWTRNAMKKSVRIVSVLSKIQFRHLLSTSQMWSCLNELLQSSGVMLLYMWFVSLWACWLSYLLHEICWHEELALFLVSSRWFVVGCSILSLYLYTSGIQVTKISICTNLGLSSEKFNSFCSCRF